MTGSRNRGSFTLGRTSDLPSGTRGKSRMHKGARTDPCGGRGVTRVPTATHPSADSSRSERPVRVGPFLTLLCHRRPKFPVMHNVPCSKDVLGSERWLEGSSETARV